MNAIAYPRLIKRVRAVLIDSILIPVSVLGVLILGDALGVTHFMGKMALLLVPIFILEPGLVAVTGGTVGHHLQGIRITRIDGQGNINIFAATIRFVVKLALGWLSFMFVFTAAKHQAVHDLVARSVVIHKNTDGLPAHELLAQRTFDTLTYVSPPAWRRVIVILAYLFIATISLSIVSTIFSSSDCLEMDRCTAVENWFGFALSIGWIVVAVWLMVRGWQGLLYGCMRRQRESAA